MSEGPHTERVNAERQPQRFDADALIAKLNRLRDSGRLAIHMWESDNANTQPAFTFPDFSYEHISEGDCSARDERIKHALAKNDSQNVRLCLMSMSLIPSCNKHKSSLIPYLCEPFWPSQAGYLVNLHQNQAYPARVLAGYNGDLMTANAPYAKIKDVIALQSAAVTQSKRANIHVIRPNEDMAAASTRILDALSEEISEKSGYQEETPNEINEIVVASGKEHIAAIVVPIFHRNVNKLEASIATAAAAIAGIHHLNKGLDLPVVTYHVDSEDRGKFEYIGKGRATLQTKLIDAVEQIDRLSQTQMPQRNDDQDLRVLIKLLKAPDILGFDMDVSKHTRDETLKRLKVTLPREAEHQIA